MFQQDNAPDHQAPETVEFCFELMPDFILPLMWPPKQP